MQSLIISLNAVLPMFITLAIGYFLKGRGFFTDDALTQINKLVFRLLLPLQIFKSVFRADLGEVVNPRYLLTNAALALGTFAVMAVFVARFVRVPQKRGALLQGMYRGNLALIGMSLAEALFGAEQTGTMAVLIAVLVPIYNVLAVITLESARGGKADPGKIAKGVATNPLIIACLLGLAANLAGLTLPVPAESVLNNLSSCATPIALIVLGASFHIEKVSEDKAYIVLGVATKLVLLPLVAVGIGAALGFRGVELGTMAVVFCSPVAVSSFPMAQQMGADADLAASLVVFSGMFSCFTIFLFVFSLLQLGWM